MQGRKVIAMKESRSEQTMHLPYINRRLRYFLIIYTPGPIILGTSVGG